MHVTDFTSQQTEGKSLKSAVQIAHQRFSHWFAYTSQKKNQDNATSHAWQDRRCNFAHCPFAHTKSDRERESQRTAGKGRWLSSFTVRLQSAHASATAARLSISAFQSSSNLYLFVNLPFSLIVELFLFCPVFETSCLRQVK